MLAVDQCSDNYRKKKDRQHVAAQRIVVKMVTQGAVRKKRNHVIEAEQRFSGERNDNHDAESQIGDERNVM